MNSPQGKKVRSWVNAEERKLRGRDGEWFAEKEVNGME